MILDKTIRLFSSLTCLSFLIILWSTYPVLSLDIYAASVSPTAFSKDGHIQGFSVDIAREVAKRVGNETQHILLLPFKRAIQIPRLSSNSMVANLARTPGREGHYTWFFKIAEVSSHYVTLQGGASHTHKTAAALNLVGVLSGSAVQSILKKQPEIVQYASPNEETSLKMLTAGRIDAWFTSTILMAGALRNSDSVTSGDLNIGPKIGETFSIYAAGSLGIEKEQVDRWRTAFEQMKKDGTYQAIMNRYLVPDPILKIR